MNEFNDEYNDHQRGWTDVNIIHSTPLSAYISIHHKIISKICYGKKVNKFNVIPNNISDSLESEGSDEL